MTVVTPEAVAFARAINEQKNWDALPALADMLEEQGYSFTVWLEHFRDPDVNAFHYRVGYCSPLERLIQDLEQTP